MPDLYTDHGDDYWDSYGIYGPGLPSVIVPPSPVSPYTAPYSPPAATMPPPPVYTPPDSQYLPPATPPTSPSFPQAGPVQTAPVVAAVAVIGFGWLVGRLGLIMGGSIWGALKIAGRAGAIRWNSLPTWIKTALAGAGIVAGTDIVLDEFDVGPDQPGGGLSPFLPSPGEDVGAVGSTIDSRQVVRRWTANGTVFVRLADGMSGAMKRDGTWKFWRPKKPTVLFAGGASDLRTLLKADGIVNNQIKRLKKVINRRHPTRRRSQCSTCGRVACICK